MNLRFYIGNLSGFVIVGGIFYGLAVGINWIAIDLMGLHDFYAPFVIISILFMLKYYCYLRFQTIIPNLLRYILGNSAVTLVSTLTITILIRYAGMDGWLSSAISLSFFMILRYMALLYLGVIRRPSEHYSVDSG